MQDDSFFVTNFPRWKHVATLTEKRIREAAAAAKPYTLKAGGGLHLHVSRAGSKRWRYRYRLGPRCETVVLGRWPAMSAALAREKAAAMRRLLEQRQDPAEEMRRSREIADTRATVADFGARWMREVVEHARKKPGDVERILRRDVYPALGQRPVALVTAAEVQAVIFARRDAGAPEAAAAIRQTLKRLFEYAQACGLCRENPTAATPLKYVVRHRSRERTLSRSEIKVLLQRCDAASVNYRLRLALRLILLTLCRKSELRQARWEHIDLEAATWEIPAEHSKTGKPHIVYLSRQAVDCFRHLRGLSGRAEVVLPARDAITVPIGASILNKQMQRVRWGIAHFTPHDLRRTASTVLNELGYNADWIEKALNHSARGVRGVYNRAQYAEQRRTMLQEWADWLDAL